MGRDEDRILLALETLVQGGLLARATLERRAELRAGAAGYRLARAFWAAVGAVAPGADGFEQQVTSLRDPFARASLHHRIVAEFLGAGAPLWWANEAAGAALGALRCGSDGAAGDGAAGDPPPSG